MIIVHETFICKPGNASKLAKLFKDERKSERLDRYVHFRFEGDFSGLVIPAACRILIGNLSNNFELLKSSRDIPLHTVFKSN